MLRIRPGAQAHSSTTGKEQIELLHHTAHVQPGTGRLIDLTLRRDRLLHNAAVLRSLTGTTVKHCAVVKANAYGHGVARVVDALRQQVDAFGVATISEALEIAPLSGDKFILVMTPLFAGIHLPSLHRAILHDCHLTLCSVDALHYLLRGLPEDAPPVKVHLKIDTGMGRCGAWEATAVTLLKLLSQTDRVQLTGVYTHFAGAEEGHSTFMSEQEQRFRHFLIEHNLLHRDDVMIHAGNSEATLLASSTHFNMVRCGLAFYGAVNGDLTRRFDLRPALKVQAPLVQIKHLPAGATCGYGRTFTAPDDRLIGIVPAGYAEGLRRCLSNKASLLVRNIPCPILGRISMDLTIIDLSRCPDAVEGEPVTLIDDNPESPCSAVTLAQLANTIPYEILSGIRS